MLIGGMVDESGCKDSVGEVDGCFGDPHYWGAVDINGVSVRTISGGN